MRRFPLLVSFVVVAVFAFMTGAVLAGDSSDKGPTKEYKQQQLTPYASLGNVIKATQKTGSSDAKVGSKKGKASVKSAHKSRHTKKVARHKTAGSKKTAYHKKGSSKPSASGKKKLLKKSPSYSKSKAPKKTANYRNGKI